jgi:hypothetical protein
VIYIIDMKICRPALLARHDIATLFSDSQVNQSERPMAIVQHDQAVMVLLFIYFPCRGSINLPLLLLKLLESQFKQRTG